MMKKLIAFSTLVIIIISSVYSQTIPDGLYFGQTPPGKEPEIFAPGIISVEDRYDYSISFSPDGKECCFGVTNSNWSASTLYYTKQDTDGKWSTPVPAYFQNGSDGWLPFFSSDNKKFFFSKGNPANIWVCTNSDSGWSNPVKLAAPVNTSSHEWCANTTNDGTLYFTSGRTEGNGDYDIYKSEPVDGNYVNVENLGPPINSSYTDASPRISSDGKFLIFESWRPDGYGKADLYISYKKNNGTWSDPQNLGPNINTSKIDDGGYISPDGKYFFFNRREDWVTNKSTDIYWVDAAFIEEMKPDDLNAYLEQLAPGDTPELFAEGILSKTGRNERVLAFTPDGKEIYFSVVNSSNNYSILFFEEIDGQWQEQKTPPFITEYMEGASCLEPFISPDGTKLLFTSKKDATGGDWDYNIWITQSTTDGWGEPEMLNSSINTTIGEWHPCITKSGNIYFARDNNYGDIYFSEYSENGYKTAVPISNINSSSSDYDPYVDPDEKYIIFKSNRSGGYGKMDNYISYKDTVTGTWSTPKNLGEKINSNLADDAGDISPDGKYMFFSRTSENGEMDVYWVSTDFIDSIKQTITDVNEKKTSIPNNFKLYQNYPNPFNPSTVISYRLPAFSSVKLIIYDTLGQKIKILVDSYQNGGEYSVVWDATDDGNNQVGSGVYFYKLETDNKTLTHKMVLLR
ncbi:MAG: T9SS type A sorting domain-containing protein [Ignavibacteria bacterium]|jgi:hypothetical protein